VDSPPNRRITALESLRNIYLFAATTKELEKYPNAELAGVTDNTDHVCAAMVNGKLRMDATENQETVVPIAVPVETVRDSVHCLEEVSTGI